MRFKELFRKPTEKGVRHISSQHSTGWLRVYRDVTKVDMKLMLIPGETVIGGRGKGGKRTLGTLKILLVMARATNWK